MKNYAVIQLEKLNRQCRSDIKYRSAHVAREQFADNVDPTLSVANKTLVGNQGDDWYQLFKDRYDTLEYYNGPDKHRLRKDAVIGLEVVTSLSHDYANELNITDWADANVKWMQERYGKDNVLHATLHLDEATPHIHFFVTPIIDGKFNAKEVCGNREAYRHLQTEYAEAMESQGLARGLKRGHRSQYVKIKQLYQTVSSSPQLTNVNPGESLDEYAKRMKKEYEKLWLASKKMEQELEVAESTRLYAHELEKERDRLQDELLDLHDKTDDRKIAGLSVDALEYAIENYPDKKVIDSYVGVLKNLADWGEPYLEQDLEDEQNPWDEMDS